jgi:hypothetical protein
MSQKIQDNHRFLDEAGDTTFYGKGKVPIIGQDGVSHCFIIGMVKFKEPLQPIRRRIIELQNQIVSDPYYHEIPSINKKGKLVLNIASRGKTTKNNNLQLALEKAQSRNKGREVTTDVLFNVQNHRVEPLLNVADYFCWSIQRVFERGEVRYYNFLKDQISLVVDLYDSSHYEHSNNYYSPKKPLTAANKL